MKKVVIKKCVKCGAIVEVIKDCTCSNCGIKCCGENMITIKANSTDGAVEKHIPVIEVVGEYILVSVPHVMEDNHYIEYLALSSDKLNIKKYLKPGEKPVAIFPYVKNSEISAYCNKHGLWLNKAK